MTFGISSKDRSLQDEDLRRLAEVLGRRVFLSVELASKEDYDPEVAASERRRSALVAIDRWDSDAEKLAQLAGVDVMFVVTSASARNGKKTKQKYVPLDKSKGDQKPTSVEVTSLLYKFSTDVWACGFTDQPSTGSSEERGDDAWERVSRIRSEGERSYSPFFVSSKTEKFSWDLAAVVGDLLAGDLKQARMKLAAAWPATLDSNSLPQLYGELDESQKVEFWRRAELASPVKVGLSVESLLNLAFQEWARTESTATLGLLQQRIRVYVTSWIRSATDGWMYQDRPTCFKSSAVSAA